MEKTWAWLVTGASDDDPSGIATYSQAGASFGLATLWTAIICISTYGFHSSRCAPDWSGNFARFNGNPQKHYPRPVLYVMLVFSFPAIVMNIGADIAGMGAVGNLLFPAIEANYFSVLFTIVLLGLIIYLPYQKMPPF